MLHSSIRLCFFIPTVLASLVGCASVNSPSVLRTFSAPEQLVTQADGVRTYRKSNTASISSVVIDQASISFASDVAIDDAQRNELKEALYNALKDEMIAAGVKVVASRVDASSLTLRANITQVELVNPMMNILTTGLLFIPLSRGGMTVELEAATVQNERIAAMAFEGRGGVENIGSAFSAIGHAKTQARTVATRFSALISNKTAS